MPRTPGSHSVNTGPRIRDAAIRLIAQHGYAAVSMRQIAAEAGVQVGTIYLYYADKQALLFELMTDIMESLLQGWAGVARQDDPMARLRSFVEFCIDFSVDRPDDVRVAYLELRNLSPDHAAIIGQKRRAYERELERLLEVGIATGHVQVSDVRITTLAVLTLLTNTGIWYREGGRLSRGNVKAIYWQYVQGMVREAARAEI